MRRLLTRAALLLACLLILPFAAYGEQASSLTVSAQAVPDSMALAQEATFAFLLENTGSDGIADIAILFPEANGQHPVGALAAGAVSRVEFPYPVTEDDLTAGGVTFSVSSSGADGSSLPDIEVTVPLSREAERPEVELTRQLSGRYVHVGQQATLVYQVKNTGNVPLTSLEINDPLGDFTRTLERLEIGAAHTFINRVVIDEAAASTPTLRFSSAASGQSYTKSLTSASIVPAEENLTAEMTVDKTEVAYGETVTVTLTLTNSGNVSYSDVTLSDSTLGMLVNKPLSLPAGAEPVVITRSCAVKADSQFCVTLSGKTDAGALFTLSTEPVAVTVLKSDEASDITLTAVPSADTLSEPGMVLFTLTLTNNGQSDLSRVTLKEAQRGEIRLFDVVPAGAPTVREQMYQVSEDSTFRFTAEIPEADGATRVVSTDEILITLSEDGLAPIAAQQTGIAAALKARTLRLGSLSVYPAMILGAVVLLILLILAFVISGRRKRRERENNRAERQKRSELLGKTNPFTPVSRNRKNKEGKR